MRTNNFNYLERGSLKVAIIAGENGSGKSRYLRSVARHFAPKKPVTIVCNTVFDSFIDLKKTSKLSVAQGKNIAVKAIKLALVKASEQRNPVALKSIANVLKYCGYSEEIGIEITGLSHQAVELLQYSSFFEKLPPYLKNEIYRPFRVYKSFDKIHWVRFSELSIKSLSYMELVILIEYEAKLRKEKVFDSIKLYFKKNDEIIPVTNGSSGELTLIATRLYLDATIAENAILIIDEPENSLHPLWQKEYINKLLDILYYKQPTIVIATHSPIIVSAAQVKEEDKNNIQIEIYRLEDDKLIKLEDKQLNSSSVEDTYWNVFNTITPVNSYVSEALITELHRLSDGDTTLGRVQKLVGSMERASYDPTQQEFFDAVQNLARKINNNEVDLEEGAAGIGDQS